MNLWVLHESKFLELKLKLLKYYSYLRNILPEILLIEFTIHDHPSPYHRWAVGLQDFWFISTVLPYSSLASTHCFQVSILLFLSPNLHLYFYAGSSIEYINLITQYYYTT